MKLEVPVIARNNASTAGLIKHQSTGLLYSLPDVRICARMKTSFQFLQGISIACYGKGVCSSRSGMLCQITQNTIIKSAHGT